jgi:hypothetical protein
VTFDLSRPAHVLESFYLSEMHRNLWSFRGEFRFPVKISCLWVPVLFKDTGSHIQQALWEIVYINWLLKEEFRGLLVINFCCNGGDNNRR